MYNISVPCVIHTNWFMFLWEGKPNLKGSMPPSDQIIDPWLQTFTRYWNVIFFLLGNTMGYEFYGPTIWNILSVPHKIQMMGNHPKGRIWQIICVCFHEAMPKSKIRHFGTWYIFCHTAQISNNLAVLQISLINQAP
jgi:hypothetical protein